MDGISESGIYVSMWCQSLHNWNLDMDSSLGVPVWVKILWCAIVEAFQFIASAKSPRSKVKTKALSIVVLISLAMHIDILVLDLKTLILSVPRTI